MNDTVWLLTACCCFYIDVFCNIKNTIAIKLYIIGYTIYVLYVQWVNWINEAKNKYLQRTTFTSDGIFVLEKNDCLTEVLFST